MAALFPSERSTKDVINSILDDYEKLTKELFESLSATSLYRTTKQDASSGETAKAVDQLISKEKELQAAIEKVQEQQARQQEIQTVREKISKKDQEILNLESQLKEAEKILALFQAKKKLSAINQASKGMVSSEDLIKYAHRISSSNAVEAPVSWMPGDPRRPYPQDIEMRSGWLGRLMEGVPNETEGPGSDLSTPQEVVQSSAPASQILHPAGGLGLTNGQAAAFSWQSQLPGGQSASLQQDASSSLDILTNNLTKEVTNGRQEQGVDEVEFMSSSSSSSSSDSP